MSCCCHRHLFVFVSVLACLAGGQVRGEFSHPGLLHTRADLERMKEAVAAKQNPVLSGFKVLAESPRSSANYRMLGPFENIGRMPTIHMGEAASDAAAAYQNALMWFITGERAHANKAIEILNAWSVKHKRVTGIDGVLGAGLQGFKFANAAEIIRYSDAGWSREDAEGCERWFKDAWLPTIEHYAYFANGNWESAALQTKMAIAVYCNDRDLFDETVRYAVDGAGNGSITHTVVFPSGQAQETTRKQHYAQLGLGLLCNAAGIAWNQGVDLYGWADNRILKGMEYNAKYGLREEVPYEHYLDRTGKYGFGGRHQHYDKISTISRGNFTPIFEQPYNHYVMRRGLPAPSLRRVIEKIRPEGMSGDQVGLGTLTHWRSLVATTKPTAVPGTPAGVIARTTTNGIALTWPRSVDPGSCRDATSYSVLRAEQSGGPYEPIAVDLRDAQYEDRTAKKGTLYHYVIRARNELGESGSSVALAACAGLPGPWKQVDVGAVRVAGTTEYNGETFDLEGEGRDIGGAEDQFQFAYAKMTGDGAITARIVLPLTSGWSKLGVMMRESLASDSRHASVLLLPPNWGGGLVSRSKAGAETVTAGFVKIGEPHVIKGNRLMKPWWVKLVRVGDQFTGFMSSDGVDWCKLASTKVAMGSEVLVGLPACSQLKKVTTTVTYDKVSIPGWEMAGAGDVPSAHK